MLRSIWQMVPTEMILDTLLFFVGVIWVVLIVLFQPLERLSQMTNIFWKGFQPVICSAFDPCERPERELRLLISS